VSQDSEVPGGRFLFYGIAGPRSGEEGYIRQRVIDLRVCIRLIKVHGCVSLY
jgi:hypothetical protein